MPEVTRRSPFWISAFEAMKRSSSMPLAPAPKATARRPLRTTCTGIAWSLSVSSVTSAASACARVTWPITPASSTTGEPARTPLWLPLSITTFLEYGSRPL